MQAMSLATERRYAAPPPDLTRYKLLEIERQQFALGIHRRPHPAGRTRELLNGLGFTHFAISHRTEHRVEFIELDLIERQLGRK